MTRSHPGLVQVPALYIVHRHFFKHMILTTIMCFPNVSTDYQQYTITCMYLNLYSLKSCGIRYFNLIKVSSNISQFFKEHAYIIVHIVYVGIQAFVFV